MNIVFNAKELEEVYNINVLALFKCLMQYKITVKVNKKFIEDAIFNSKFYYLLLILLFLCVYIFLFILKYKIQLVYNLFKKISLFLI